MQLLEVIVPVPLAGLVAPLIYLGIVESPRLALPPLIAR